MCGIYGEIHPGLDAGERKAFHVSAERALRHRGPDGSGVWFDEHCLLGHTRLAIVDLTSAADQPMRSASGRAHLVFNGEIYNYVEARGELGAPPGGWRSASDTEVLLEALERRGLDGLRPLVGMFAFALWRPAECELLLCRDRLGKKPLYWARTPSGGLRFASELGALLADGVLSRTTTADRIAEFLQHGYVASPRSGLVEVNALPPGSALRARIAPDGRIDVTIDRYFRVPLPAQATDERRWRDEFDATLQDAVRIRLRADVPLGAFLSGGVDSSVVSLLASRLSGGALRTFTIDFAERAFSEGAYAAEVARHIGAKHTELTLDQGALLSLSELVAAYGDLHGDSSALPTMAVCRAARDHVTVALSGDGGDELLGGYRRYARALRTVEMVRKVPGALLSVLRAGAGRLPPWVRGATRIASLDHDVGAFYRRDLRMYGATLWPPVLGEPAMEWPDVVGRAVETHRDRAALLRLMATDVETYLPEDILVKVDRASMAVGLEVRSPLLDHRLLQLVMAADPRWIADAQGGKVPLRTIYGVQLPPAVFNRPKTGFGVPLGRWLRSDLDTFASDRLLDRRAPIAALLDRAATRRMLLLHRAGAGDHSVWIWNLLVLDAWLDLWRPAIRTASASAPEPAFALP